MIVIGVLRERFANWSFVDCLDLLGNDLVQHNIKFGKIGIRATNIYRGRRFVVDKALEEPEMTHVFFLDSDEVFAPETARHLYNLNLPVCTGIVFQRIPPHPPCIYKRIPNSDRNFALAPELQEWYKKYSILELTKPCILDMPAEDAIWEIDECGTGCLMIKREVLEAIEPPRFTGMGDVGTDIAFCRRVRAAGFPIYVDLRVQLGHLVEYAVSAADFAIVDEWLPDYGEEHGEFRMIDE